VLGADARRPERAQQDMYVAKGVDGWTSSSSTAWTGSSRKTARERANGWQTGRVVIASFVVSTVALAIAIVSAGYTRIQGLETRKLREIEASRRHEERTPELTGEVEAVNSGGWYRLWLTLDSPWSLSQLEVRIIETQGISFSTTQDGVAPLNARPLDAVRSELFNQGERHSWAVEYDPVTGPSKMRLRIACHGSDDNGAEAAWTVLLDIDLPFDLTRSFG
jgi:hypothetical protein